MIRAVDGDNVQTTPTETVPQPVCWGILDGAPYHFGHLDRCIRELDSGGNIVDVAGLEGSAESSTREDVKVGDGSRTAPDVGTNGASPEPDPSSRVTDPDGSGDGDTPSPGLVEPVPAPVVSPTDELYQRLIAEGNPPQLSITLATLYAEWKAAAVPETMGELRGLLSSLAGFFGSNGDAKGMLGKLMGKALKG